MNVLTPDDFQRLRAHLSRLDSVIKRFCGEYEFVERTTALGRYPRRYVRRAEEVNLFFDLQMDLDSRGDYYRLFHPSIPYSMGAGAGIDLGQVRHSIIFWCFQKLPFSEVENTLWNHLVVGYEKMKEWNKDYLLKNGTKSPISNGNTGSKRIA